MESRGLFCRLSDISVEQESTFAEVWIAIPGFPLILASVVAPLPVVMWYDVPKKNQKVPLISLRRFQLTPTLPPRCPWLIAVLMGEKHACLWKGSEGCEVLSPLLLAPRPLLSAGELCCLSTLIAFTGLGFFFLPFSRSWQKQRRSSK